MDIKIEHRVILPSGIVVDYAPGHGVRVERDGVVYHRGVDGGGVYEVMAYGRRVKVGDSWLQVDPVLSDAVLAARRALVAAVEELTA